MENPFCMQSMPLLATQDAQSRVSDACVFARCMKKRDDEP